MGYGEQANDKENSRDMENNRKTRRTMGYGEQAKDEENDDVWRTSKRQGERWHTEKKQQIRRTERCRRENGEQMGRKKRKGTTG